MLTYANQVLNEIKNSSCPAARTGRQHCDYDYAIIMANLCHEIFYVICIEYDVCASVCVLLIELTAAPWANSAPALAINEY